MEAPSLPANVAAKYELKHLQPGTYDIVGFGEVDLTKLDLKTAARLAKKTPFLVVKSSAPAVAQ